MPIQTKAHGCNIILLDRDLVRARDGWEMIGNTQDCPNEWVTLSEGITSRQLHSLAEKCTPQGLINTIRTKVLTTIK